MNETTKRKNLIKVFLFMGVIIAIVFLSGCIESNSCKCTYEYYYHGKTIVCHGRVISRNGGISELFDCEDGNTYSNPQDVKVLPDNNNHLFCNYC